MIKFSNVERTYIYKKNFGNVIVTPITPKAIIFLLDDILDLLKFFVYNPKLRKYIWYDYYEQDKLLLDSFFDKKEIESVTSYLCEKFKKIKPANEEDNYFPVFDRIEYHYLRFEYFEKIYNTVLNFLNLVGILKVYNSLENILKTCEIIEKFQLSEIREKEQILDNCFFQKMKLDYVVSSGFSERFFREEIFYDDYGFYGTYNPINKFYFKVNELSDKRKRICGKEILYYFESIIVLVQFFYKVLKINYNKEEKELPYVSFKLDNLLFELLMDKKLEQNKLISIEEIEDIKYRENHGKIIWNLFKKENLEYINLSYYNLNYGSYFYF